MNNLLNFFNLKHNQTVNNCYEPVYKLSDIERLKRFIFLGSDNGSMYMNKDTLTLENILCLENLLEDCKYDDILEVINTYKHNTFKKDYLIYVLARCCSIHLDDDPLFWKKDFRTDCFKIVLDVCHIPSYLFMFINFYEKINQRLYNSTGWNSQLKNMISQWYLLKTSQELMYHVTKYPSRYSWSHKDILKLAHIKPKDDITNDIFKYILYNNLDRSKSYLEYLEAYEKLKTDDNVDNVIDICRQTIHIRHVEQPRFRALDRLNDNLQMRINYMRNKINKEDFKKVLQKKEKENMKRGEISNIIGMYVSVMTDLMYRVLDGGVGGVKSEMNELRVYTNNCLEVVSKTDNCKKYSINEKFEFN